jgi:hypothetical protein
MPSVEFRHEIDCDEDTYWWKLCFDEAFNKAMYVEDMKFPDWSLLDQKQDDDKLTRKVQVEPPTGNLPGPVKKVLGDRLKYTEEGTFDKKTRRYTFKVVPSTLAEKTKVSGEMWVEKVGDKKIRRMAKISVDVKVMLVGGMVEEKILEDLRKSYERGSAFTNEYIKKHGL